MSDIGEHDDTLPALLRPEVFARDQHAEWIHAWRPSRERRPGLLFFLNAGGCLALVAFFCLSSHTTVVWLDALRTTSTWLPEDSGKVRVVVVVPGRTLPHSQESVLLAHRDGRRWSGSVEHVDCDAGACAVSIDVDATDIGALRAGSLRLGVDTKRRLRDFLVSSDTSAK